ncbi:glycosyltransferase family 2 protein [Sphingomonas sp. 35-24ZXX]|uniref:glycosyltransferase family 2 protein n=1 Tax=Sphingomonas sp. 35-24ZXX TaxID=1545915 RepID=UPI0009DCCF14|nr:glycosyltransferase [Sphingomonas sp. 35-24ZXX]
MTKVAVIIPTLNAGHLADQMVHMLKKQKIQPSDILVIDSGSTDNTAHVFREFGARVFGLPGQKFNHGGTRKYAASLCGECDILVFMTQDAIPASGDSIARLCTMFDDPNIGMAYGRQLPRDAAGFIERHARLRNYPAASEIRTIDDRGLYGVKVTFCSNSFCAYRTSAYESVGGFPEDSYFGEDQVIAGRMLLAGYKIKYDADAAVVHSHGYSIIEDFRRYFDVGVFHARNTWLLEEFGSAEGEGFKFLKSEMHYLSTQQPSLIFSALARSVLKLIGYRMGRLERRLPKQLKAILGMQKFYWK